MQTRSLELISGNDCRKEEVKEEASTLDESINTFATLLDERREILVLSVECFKACKNVSLHMIVLCYNHIWNITINVTTYGGINDQLLLVPHQSVCVRCILYNK